LGKSKDREKFKSLKPPKNPGNQQFLLSWKEGPEGRVRGQQKGKKRINKTNGHSPRPAKESFIQERDKGVGVQVAGEPPMAPLGVSLHEKFNFYSH